MSNTLAIPTTDCLKIQDHQELLVNLGPEPLSAGDVGASVKILQRVLTGIGFYHGDEDGHFGHQTRDSILLVQKQLGLMETGNFDEGTWYGLTFWHSEFIDHQDNTNDSTILRAIAKGLDSLKHLFSTEPKHSGAM